MDSFGQTKYSVTIEVIGHRALFLTPDFDTVKPNILYDKALMSSLNTIIMHFDASWTNEEAAQSIQHTVWPYLWSITSGGWGKHRNSVQRVLQKGARASQSRSKFTENFNSSLQSLWPLRWVCHPPNLIDYNYDCSISSVMSTFFQCAQDVNKCMIKTSK